MSGVRGGRLGLVALVCLMIVVLGGTAQSAVAAPELDVEISHKRSVLPPFGRNTFRVSVVNTGTTATTAPVELDVSLPPGVSAISAGDESGVDVWQCTVSIGGAQVHCDGPNAAPSLPPGGVDVCIDGGLPDPCPVLIEAEVAGDAPMGPAQVSAEACGGGAAACAAAVDDIEIANFGDGFGVAPINGHPDAGEDQAPAYPGSHAVWAGTCATALAPAPPAFVAPPAPPPAPAQITDPTGFGGIPHSVWIPDPTLLGGFATGTQFEVPAPLYPGQCIDWGRLAPHGNPQDPSLWREQPPRAGPPSWRLPAVTQAGGHPDGTAAFWFNRHADGFVDGTVDNVYAFLPAGFVGDPNAIVKCSAEEFSVRPLECPPASQVGIVRVYLSAAVGSQNYPNSNEEILPVYNLEPRQGRLAEFGIAYVSGEDATTVRLTATARTDGDFGVTTLVGQIPAALPLISQSITIWGVPWAAENDLWRPPAGWRPPQGPGFELVSATGEIPPTGVPVADRVGWEPSWGPVRPFVSNPTECTGGDLQTLLAVDSYESQGAFDSDGDPAVDLNTPDEDASQTNWHTYGVGAPAVTGCGKLPFGAGIDLAPSSTVADSPSGLSVELDVPQNRDLPFDPPPVGASQPAIDDYLEDAAAFWRSDPGLATSHLGRAVVTLPEGVSINPSGAAGVQGCSDVQIGVTDAASSPMVFNNGDPYNRDGGADGAECPDGAKIGTVEVDTPLLDDPLTGELVLGTPKSTNPMSGQMFRLFVVVRDRNRGLIAKIAGSTVADPQTGKLTTTFDRNPRVPFETMRLQLKGGARGLLALPQECASKGWTAGFSPWTAAHGAPGSPVSRAGAFLTDRRCGFGFAPTTRAGTAPNRGGGSGTFTFHLARNDGEQWFDRLSAKLPPGLLASVRGLPLCSDAQAAANRCPAGSRIGSVDAAAGSGSPFFLEREGAVYLTEGYKGAPYGLAVSIPVEAGPFRGRFALSPIVVRQALEVDPTTAQVTAVSDPFPRIHHGIPLRVREVLVNIDRPNFMLNPSGCSPKQVQATILSAKGTRADVANHFQAANCAALPFKPRLGLRLTGRKQTRTGRHPGIRALVRQRGIGEAGIQRAEVRLPKTLALDVDNAQALCEFEDGAKPDLENHCPRGSIVGRARAQTPLLNRPLAGNVYFVKNVRRDPDTGNVIRTLPMIVAALRGEIAVNLVGESDVKRGKLVSTFANIPDAPISQFNMNIRGGRNGIVAVTRTRRSLINLCSSGRQVAEADMDGQNGKRHDFNVAMRKPCPRRRRSAAAVCRKRTNTKPAMRRCVRRVKANRARAAKRKAAVKRKQAAAKRRNARG